MSVIGLLSGVIVVSWVGVLLAIFMDLPSPFDRLFVITGAVVAIPFALECQGYAL
ncbi:hypothetical protein [Alcanivorax sp.]|jgi:putative membrane protein|uniref:hypothetical protein n=1 Tax=Alcanivorax sp. TaxID=1872427 RepID=UPI0032D91368